MRSLMFILASESPRRRELLAKLGYSFTTENALVSELADGDDPRAVPEQNARRKAAAVARRHPDALVLGADTAILFEGRLWGKPVDRKDAAAMLRRFSGHTHAVITGMALVCRADGLMLSWSESAGVTFGALSDEEIEIYLNTVKVLDKAGAYAIQEHPELLRAVVSGELENVIGLPLVRLRRELTGRLGEPLR